MMKIVRYLDPEGRIQHGRLQPDGTTTRLDGDLSGDRRDTGESARVAKWLAPFDGLADRDDRRLGRSDRDGVALAWIHEQAAPGLHRS
jgi:hypothetical protein